MRRKTVILSSSITVFIAVIVLVCLYVNPPITDDVRARFHSVDILDRHEALLRRLPSPSGTYGRWWQIDNISSNIVVATIAAEDKRFFIHPGVDPLAMARALIQNIKEGRIVSGASTIPEQLLRISKGYPRRLSYKLLIQLESLWLTLSMSKREQLEYYLNLISYGGDGVGIYEGSKRYFGKDPANLTLAESCFLAVIPRSPQVLNPLTNFMAVKKRQVDLLDKLHRSGEVSTALYSQALTEKIRIVKPSPRPFLAPHFTERVRRGMKNRSGQVETTLDLDWQNVAESLMREHLSRVKKYRIENAAVVVIDNSTSEIRAWIGSHDFFDQMHDGQNDGAIAFRQPGSALKPFVYALALENGFTTASILPDIRTHYFLNKGEYYIPRNYSGEYRGPVRLRMALAGSLNIPAVYVAKQIGPAKILGLFKDLHFELTKPPWYYGLGIALGNPEVRLIDVTNAFAALARGGVWRPVVFLSDQRRDDLREVVIQKEVAALVTDILSDTNSRDQIFGFQNPFHFSFPAAIKTGTSSNWRDNWSFGYTEDVTVGVWVGNFDGEPMLSPSGATGAGPLLRDVIKFVATKYPGHSEFASKSLLSEAAVCSLSGKKAHKQCPQKIVEYFMPGTAPLEECDWHREIEVDQRNGLLATNSCQAKYTKRASGVVFPEEYREWATEHGFGLHEYSRLCSDKPEARVIAISYPKEGSAFLINPVRRKEFQTIPLKLDVEGNVLEVEWWVDGRPYKKVDSAPFSSRYILEPGKHSIKAIAHEKESEVVNFEVF